MSLAFRGARETSNATLTGAADAHLTGNGYDHVLTGNGGDNFLDGGEGRDTVVFAGPASDYEIERLGDVMVVSARPLTGMERTHSETSSSCVSPTRRSR